MLAAGLLRLLLHRLSCLFWPHSCGLQALFSQVYLMMVLQSCCPGQIARFGVEDDHFRSAIFSLYGYWDRCCVYSSFWTVSVNTFACLSCIVALCCARTRFHEQFYIGCGV